MSRIKLFSVTLADCDVSTFSAGGAGGQHRDHGNSAVRIVHRASGASGTASDNRSQLQNKKAAFRRMTAHPKFKIWLNREIFARAGRPSPEELVKQDMEPGNLRVETRPNGRWEVVD